MRRPKYNPHGVEMLFSELPIGSRFWAVRFQLQFIKVDEVVAKQFDTGEPLPLSSDCACVMLEAEPTEATDPKKLGFKYNLPDVDGIKVDDGVGVFAYAARKPKKGAAIHRDMAAIQS